MADNRLGFEAVSDVAAAQRNFDTLTRTMLETGGVSASIRFGTKSVSTSASTTGTASVTHGMGATPLLVVATALNSTGGLTNVCVDTIGATTFNTSIKFTDGVARTTSITVGWIAIGG